MKAFHISKLKKRNVFCLVYQRINGMVRASIANILLQGFKGKFLLRNRLIIIQTFNRYLHHSRLEVDNNDDVL